MNALLIIIICKLYNSCCWF